MTQINKTIRIEAGVSWDQLRAVMPALLASRSIQDAFAEQAKKGGKPRSKIPHWGTSILILSMLVSLLILSGCSTYPVGYDGPCPARPELVGIDAELQADIPPHTLEIIASNQLKLKQHIKDLEALAGCSR